MRESLCWNNHFFPLELLGVTTSTAVCTSDSAESTNAPNIPPPTEEEGTGVSVPSDCRS